MQALMLAAGMGRRLGRFTDNNTKCMLEVAGEKLIDRAIQALKYANIKRFIIVVGYKVYNSQPNFIMVKINKDSTKVAIELLEKHNIFVKDLYRKDTFENPEFIRLAIRDRKDNERIIATLIREASL